MPRAPRPYHHCMVFLNSYASAEIKEGVETGHLFITSPDQLVATLFYSGNDERQASIKFTQACKQAMREPLAYLVVLLRDNDEIARVKPDR